MIKWQEGRAQDGAKILRVSKYWMRRQMRHKMEDGGNNEGFEKPKKQDSEQKRQRQSGVWGQTVRSALMIRRCPIFTYIHLYTHKNTTFHKYLLYIFTINTLTKNTIFDNAIELECFQCETGAVSHSHLLCLSCVTSQLHPCVTSARNTTSATQGALVIIARISIAGSHPSQLSRITTTCKLYQEHHEPYIQKIK